MKTVNSESVISGAVSGAWTQTVFGLNTVSLFTDLLITLPTEGNR